MIQTLDDMDLNQNITPSNMPSVVLLMQKRVQKILLTKINREDFLWNVREDIVQDTLLSLIGLLDTNNSPEITIGSLLEQLQVQVQKVITDTRKAYGKSHETSMVVLSGGAHEEVSLEALAVYDEGKSVEARIDDKGLHSVISAYLSQRAGKHEKEVVSALLAWYKIDQIAAYMQCSKREIRKILSEFVKNITAVKDQAWVLTADISESALIGEMQEIMSSTAISTKKEPLSFEVRPYQTTAWSILDGHVQEYIDNRCSANVYPYPTAALLDMTTWSWKTYTLFSHIDKLITTDVLWQSAYRILVMVDKVEAMDQLYADVYAGYEEDSIPPILSSSVINNTKVYMYSSKHEKPKHVKVSGDDTHNSVFFTTFDSAAKIPRRDFDIIVVDEAHHMPAETYLETVNLFYFWWHKKGFPLLYPMTGTSDYRLKMLVWEPKFSYPLQEYVKSKYAPKIDYKVIFHPAASLNPSQLVGEMKRVLAMQDLGGKKNAIKTLETSLNSFLPKMLNHDALIDFLLANIGYENIPETLIFCDSITEAEYVAARIKRKIKWIFDDVRAYHSKSEENGLAMLRRGEINILVTVAKLDEAINIPDVEHIVLWSHISASTRRLFQRLWRWMRWKRITYRDFVAWFRHLSWLFDISRVTSPGSDGIEKYGGTKEFQLDLFGAEPGSETLLLEIPALISEIQSIQSQLLFTHLDLKRIQILNKILVPHIGGKSNFKHDKRSTYAEWRNTNHASTYNFELPRDATVFTKYVIASTGSLKQEEGMWMTARALLNWFWTLEEYERYMRLKIQKAYRDKTIKDDDIHLLTRWAFAKRWNMTYWPVYGVELTQSLRSFLQQLGGDVELWVTHEHITSLLLWIPYSQQSKLTKIEFERQKILDAVIDGTLEIWAAASRLDRNTIAKARNEQRSAQYWYIKLNVSRDGFYRQIGVEVDQIPAWSGFREVCLATIYWYVYGSEEYRVFVKESMLTAYKDGAISDQDLSYATWSAFSKERNKTYAHIYWCFLAVSFKDFFEQIWYVWETDRSRERAKAILNWKELRYEKREEYEKDAILRAFLDWTIPVTVLSRSAWKPFAQRRNETHAAIYHVVLKGDFQAFAEQQLWLSSSRIEYVLAILAKQNCEPGKVEEYMRMQIVKGLKETLQKDDLARFTHYKRGKFAAAWNTQHAARYGVLLPATFPGLMNVLGGSRSDAKNYLEGLLF